MNDYNIISDKRHDLGESPVWDDEKQMLYWADLYDQTIYGYHEETNETISWNFGETIGSFGLAQDNKLVVALRSGIYLFDLKTEQLTHIVTPQGEPFANTRFNDGKISPDGHFFVGTMDERIEENLGKLYCITKDGEVKLIKDGFMVSNGLAWSPDGQYVYHSCSSAQKIWRYCYSSETQEFLDEELFATTTLEIGKPDGGACDVAGGYWSAGVFGGNLNCFDNNGKLDKQIPLPMKGPTMPCFGGRDMKTIYITSLTKDHTPQDFEDYPLSGGVIAIKSDVAGVKIPKFLYQS